MVGAAYSFVKMVVAMCVASTSFLKIMTLCGNDWSV